MAHQRVIPSAKRTFRGWIVILTVSMVPFIGGCGFFRKPVFTPTPAMTPAIAPPVESLPYAKAAAQGKPVDAAATTFYLSSDGTVTTSDGSDGGNSERIPLVLQQLRNRSNDAAPPIPLRAEGKLSYANLARFLTLGHQAGFKAVRMQTRTGDEKSSSVGTLDVGIGFHANASPDSKHEPKTLAIMMESVRLNDDEWETRWLVLRGEKRFALLPSAKELTRHLEQNKSDLGKDWTIALTGDDHLPLAELATAIDACLLSGFDRIELRKPVNRPDLSTETPAITEAPQLLTTREKDDPYTIPPIFAARRGVNREQLPTIGGGNAESEAAFAAGLKWLAVHQAPDGRWSSRDFNQHGKCKCAGQSRQDDVATTGYCLLPFLAGGQAHVSHRTQGNPYAKSVSSGLVYLLTRQNREGVFHPLLTSHALATIAVCEAYALTGDPALKDPAQRALNHIVQAQSPQGGWRFLPGQEGYDTHVGGWQLQALKAGQLAGLNVPTQTLKNALKWLDDAGTADGSAYGNTRRGDEEESTVIGLFCRQQLGWGPRHPGMVAGVKRIHRIGPGAERLVYSYYATQVCFNANVFNVNPAGWGVWNYKMRDALIRTQSKGADLPHSKGSWYTNNEHSEGRLIDTALALLTLEVYYRYPFD